MKQAANKPNFENYKLSLKKGPLRTTEEEENGLMENGERLDNGEYWLSEPIEGNK